MGLVVCESFTQELRSSIFKNFSKHKFGKLLQKIKVINNPAKNKGKRNARKQVKSINYSLYFCFACLNKIFRVDLLTLCFLYLAAFLSSHYEKAINALYELVLELPAICPPHQDGGIRPSAVGIGTSMLNTCVSSNS